MIYKREMKKRKTLAVHSERVEEEIANESSGRRKKDVDGGGLIKEDGGGKA